MLVTVGAREEIPTQLAELFELWRSGELCDVVIETKEQCFHAHRTVLASASPYFRRLFRVGMLDSTAPVVLEELSTAAVAAGMLELVYTGACEIECDLLPPLLQAVEYLQLSHAVHATSHALLSLVSTSQLVPDACFLVPLTADRLDAPELRAAVWRTWIRVLSQVCRGWTSSQTSCFCSRREHVQLSA